ncbi:MAG TPA: HAD family phosphatase [Flavipsychrobacter sp.]|nr:HAD family phosphatase [Flavipsychrobacter sp.]
MIQGIRHIIFDLGGVLLNIDYNLTAEAFRMQGFGDFDVVYSQLKQERLFDELETGRISRDDFTEKLSRLSKTSLSEEKIIEAWNAMLLDMPLRRLHILQQLRLHYDLILLSNTNEIHEEAFNSLTMKEHGVLIAGFFDKVYFSHRIGMRKPDKEVFERILLENGFEAKHTLFIDDSPQHIETAKSLDIQTIYLEKGMTIEDNIFKPKQH